MGNFNAIKFENHYIDLKGSNGGEAGILESWQGEIHKQWKGASILHHKWWVENRRFISRKVQVLRVGENLYWKLRQSGKQTVDCPAVRIPGVTSWLRWEFLHKPWASYMAVSTTWFLRSASNYERPVLGP